MRLIDADLMFKCETCRHHRNGGCNTYCDHGEEYSPNMSKLPTIDPEDLRSKGRWEKHPNDYGFVRCSVCHDCIIYDEWADGKKWKYCPKCGAKMEVKSNG